jgi:hypothetical protein
VIVDFSDFLGDGSPDSHRPLPWPMLSYDPDYDQYTLEITEEQIRNAPHHDSESFEDRDWERRVHTYFKAWPYWAY